MRGCLEVLAGADLPVADRLLLVEAEHHDPGGVEQQLRGLGAVTWRREAEV
ncbi:MULTISPECIES: hypothetical protein [Pseudonocardiaceae]|uniref:hypothetical protein n=1 Tax=Pseudonocardiaceae TaxID=2070 RepID=UPI0013050EDD|nr:MULTISPECIES: hypothetical protein [Pseudonocardiaceae]